jgi:hypothetical protein
VEHEQRAAAAPGHAGRPPDQLAGVGPAVDADHHPLTDGRPLLGPSQLRPEQVTLLLLGHLAQGKGAQRGQVVGPEEVHQGRSHLVGRVDPPLGDPLTQGVGRQVDQHHLVGVVQQPVREGLPDPHPGEVLHLVVEALQVLDVHGGEHVDAGVEQLLDVLPAFGVPAAGVVGVGQLVDQAQLGQPLQQPAGVHPANGRPPTLAIRLGATSSPAARSSVARRPCGSR